MVRAFFLVLQARESWPNIRFSPEMSLCIGIFIVYCIEEVAHFLVCHDLHSPLGHGGMQDKNKVKHFVLVVMDELYFRRK